MKPLRALILAGVLLGCPPVKTKVTVSSAEPSRAADGGVQAQAWGESKWTR